MGAGRFYVPMGTGVEQLGRKGAEGPQGPTDNVYHDLTDLEEGLRPGYTVFKVLANP